MVRITLRLPDDLHKAIKELAAKESRSLNNMIVYILKEYIRKQDKQS